MAVLGVLTVVWCDSTSAGGAAFVFTLPVQREAVTV
jgi:hypothetical protein